MSQAPKEDIIDKIVATIGPPFEKKGFSLKRKRLFECKDSHGNVQQYAISLSKLKGWFSLHLSLGIFNKLLLEKVNVILEKALLDEAYPYPDVWDKKLIMDTVKVRTSSSFLTGLTDWRCFKKDDESLQEFNSRFFIWIRSFDSLDEIENWESQLLQSVEYATEWFAVTAKDDEWIIANTEYPALFLLKEKNRIDELARKYEKILSQARTKEDKEETELFYKYLTE